MQKKSTLFCKTLHTLHTEVAILAASPIKGNAGFIVRLSYNTLIEAVTGLMSRQPSH